MALNNFSSYLEELNKRATAQIMTSASGLGSASRLSDISRLSFLSPAIPTTSVALDKTSTRAINGDIQNASAGKQVCILGGRINPSGAAGIALILADYLNISGGLDATLSTTQTTNLPTAALTRFTSGVGVMAGLIMHSGVGATGVTATVSYTNQNGTPGKTSPAFTFGSSVHSTAGRVIAIPLDSGDTGVRSVESVTLSASTGTAGNFGVLLFKPLAMMMMNSYESSHIFDAVSTGGFTGALNRVDDNACLAVMVIPSNITQNIYGSVLVGEA